ncbi:related to DUF1014 domain protein [Cephalotrichum gorgonifer]|uniref:Related to DUF1014 domain protein n=1 Tax=Cephalotrichum gorgonifer TaxID=2041049 RepID=A0AAE8SRF6_9PEZI|nr:related to DUF1014 domain protein [Cephalotrichum gorgonifer]
MGNTKKGDNPKRAAGIARKAESASIKAAQQAAREAEAEDERWQKGAKSSSKKEAENEKKAEAARKKAERESLLAAEEASLPSKPTSAKKGKVAVKKTRGLDLGQLDDGPATTLNATGIDNALDALSLTDSTKQSKVDQHPERRFPAAYAKFEERRLAEMDADGSGDGLRKNQKKEKIRKEFERSSENPFNQVTARYDATKEELAAIREQERNKIEKRLGAKG